MQQLMLDNFLWRKLSCLKVICTHVCYLKSSDGQQLMLDNFPWGEIVISECHLHIQVLVEGF